MARKKLLLKRYPEKQGPAGLVLTEASSNKDNLSHSI